MHGWRRELARALRDRRVLSLDLDRTELHVSRAAFAPEPFAWAAVHLIGIERARRKDESLGKTGRCVGSVQANRTGVHQARRLAGWYAIRK